MVIHPHISLNQYKATYRAVIAAKPKVAKSRSWRYYVVLAGISLGFGVAVQFKPAQAPVLAICAAALIFSLLCKPLVRQSQEKQLERFYTEEQDTLSNQVITIDESGIFCSSEDERSRSHYDWRAFVYYIDMPDAFVFLPSPNTFVRIPKDLLTPSDDQAIRDWSRALPRR
jgi:hypothetical protein